MKPKYPFLFAIAGMLLAASFILRFYLPLGDMVDGILKGVAIGLFILAFLINGRWKNQNNTPQS